MGHRQNIDILIYLHTVIQLTMYSQTETTCYFETNHILHTPAGGQARHAVIALRMLRRKCGRKRMPFLGTRREGPPPPCEDPAPSLRRSPQPGGAGRPTKRLAVAARTSKRSGLTAYPGWTSKPGFALPLQVRAPTIETSRASCAPCHVGKPLATAARRVAGNSIPQRHPRRKSAHGGTLVRRVPPA